MKMNRGRIVLFAVLTVLLFAATGMAQPGDPFGRGIALPPGADPFGRPAVAPVEPEEKTDDTTKTEEEPPALFRGPIDPKLVRLRMLDGSVFSGELAVSEITVTTRFGDLEIPVTKLRSLRPGLDSRAQLLTQIQQWIEQLGGEDYKLRETAQAELTALGQSIRSELALHADDENAERKKRVKAILAKLEEEAMERDEEFATNSSWIRGDTIVTTSFTIVGKITIDTLAVQSKYGLLTVKLSEIKTIERPAALGREPMRRSIKLAGTNLAQLAYKSAGVRVEAGDRITVTATGQINRSGSSSYNSTPAGNSRLGTFSTNPTILGGTLVAKIGSGKVIKVGTKQTFTATQAGALRFAIGMSADYASRYQFLGQYNVKITVRPK